MERERSSILAVAALALSGAVAVFCVIYTGSLRSQLAAAEAERAAQSKALTEMIAYAANGRQTELRDGQVVEVSGGNSLVIRSILHLIDEKK